MPTTFYDAFHGIGGFRYGLEQAGWKCVGGCEIDKYACQAYGVINGERCEPADIRHIDPGRLPDFDVFVGGFPCQAFSIAGKRRGFTDTRGTLFFEICRICEVKRPVHILLENVDGLLNHDDGRTFEVILQSLDELGYDAEWQVINSAAYLPQNRERIFIIGHLRGQSGREIFPFGDENTNAVVDTGRLGQALVNISYGQLQLRSDFTCLDANYAKGLDNHGARTGVIEKIGFVGNKEAQSNRVHSIYGIMPTLFSNNQGGRNPGGLILDDRTDYRIRRLTPLECFRLQGYPDEWLYKCKEAGISDSQLYKMSGNGVSSPVAREIGLRF